MNPLRLPPAHLRKQDGYSVWGALLKGHTVAAIARALAIGPRDVQVLISGRTRLTNEQRSALEQLTGRSAAELAFDTILSRSTPQWLRENADLIKSTRELMKAFRPAGQNGAVKRRRTTISPRGTRANAAA
jgi:hypothetical protein